MANPIEKHASFESLSADASVSDPRMGSPIAQILMNRIAAHFQGLPIYFLGCALALAVDTMTLLALLKAGTPVGMAAALGFVSGMGVSYTVSVRLAFRERRLADARLAFLSFVLIGLVGLGLTTASLTWLVGELGITALLAKALTAPAVFLIGFSLRKQLLFTRTANPIR